MQNILESQVTDLALLADSPIAIPGVYSMNAQRRPTSSAESPARDNGKRKSQDSQNGGAHTRAKRNRYISIACNECKRRKIKCNGNTPCQRCGNLKLECQYAPNCCSNGFKDSEEFRQMNSEIAQLQEQVNDLYSNLYALRGRDSGELRSDVEERTLSMLNPSAPKHPRFQGPTSSAFNLAVAKNTLYHMGYPGVTEGGGNSLITEDDTPLGSPSLHSTHMVQSPSKDPIWGVNLEEAVRLCRVYEEEIGLMYPILDIERTIIHANNLYHFYQAAARNGFATESPEDSPGIKDMGSNLLKMVLAIGLIVEGAGQSDIGNRLFESVKPTIDIILHDEVVDVKCITLLVLVTMFHFHRDEEGLSWRLIGQVARMCIELGLHRRDALIKSFPEEEDRASANNVFWSVYCLDRRWSFGTGMPFALQDADIDPTLPEPELAIPYLNAMIVYSRLGSKVWRSVAGFDPISPADIKKEDIGYLDYQITQWQKGIPPELQLPTADAPQTSSRAIHRLQILLYLRANQMRILIYRPILHSASSIMENLAYSQTVVEFAKDTIRALTHLNQTSDIYRAQQMLFNYFLISALAVLFLASCHAPVQFCTVCRQEFYMALDLVKGFSSKSYISKRLWRTIKGLKEIGPELGLSEDAVPHGIEDPHSSAALAMAGLAGHEISGIGTFVGQQERSASGANRSPMNGFQMSNEMTTLFEAALGSTSSINGSTHGYPSASLQDGREESLGDGIGISGGVANTFGREEELYRHLRDLF